MLWSPYKREKYAVERLDGSKSGVGVNPIFEERDGLWNLFWLHSVHVDSLLSLQSVCQLPDIVAWTNVLTLCLKSADCMVGGIQLETLAELVSVSVFINRVAMSQTEIPIKKWLDEPENDSWLAFVTSRLEKAVPVRVK